MSGAPDITKAKYGYNALNWRTTKHVDTDLSGTVDWKSVMYYSANWQLLEERIDSNADATDDSRRQYVWGARYIDDIIHSRLDADIDGDFTDGGDKRYYHLTDVQFSTVALTNDTSTRPKVLERVTYSAYGKARHHRFADLTDEGAVNGIDLALLNGAWGGAPNPHIADLDRDGDVDGIDLALLNGDWAAAEADGVMSLSTIGNIIGWDGYVFNAESEQYHVRHRVYDPVLGRWLQRDMNGDPAVQCNEDVGGCSNHVARAARKYDDGMNLYEFTASSPLVYTDPTGLCRLGAVSYSQYWKGCRGFFGGVGITWCEAEFRCQFSWATGKTKWVHTGDSCGDCQSIGTPAPRKTRNTTPTGALNACERYAMHGSKSDCQACCDITVGKMPPWLILPGSAKGPPSPVTDKFADPLTMCYCACEYATKP